MPYTTNISAFLQIGAANPLLESYQILVAIELALKGLGIHGGTTGHNIPLMLTQIANQHPALAAQLNAHQLKLKADLARITCNDKNSQPAAVKADNYPHTRYARFTGDWNGVSETPPLNIIALAQTCNSLLSDLKSHKATLGIQI